MSPASCAEARVVGGCACAARRRPSLPCSAHRARATCFSQVSRRTPRFGRARPRTPHSFSGVQAAPRMNFGSRATCIFAFAVPPRLLSSKAGWLRLASAGPGSPPVVTRSVHTQAPPLCPTHALWGRSQTPPLPPAFPPTPGFCVCPSPGSLALEH